MSVILGIFKFVAVVILFGGIGVYCRLLLKAYWEGDAETKAMLQGSPFHSFGLPFSAMAAFGIVSLLDFPRSADGQLQITAFSLNFQGPAAPVILWVLCFAVFIWAIKSAPK
jgi:hypothetical protein